MLLCHISTQPVPCNPATTGVSDETAPPTGTVKLEGVQRCAFPVLINLADVDGWEWVMVGRYARTANKRYSADPSGLTDFETHFTVVCYEDDPALAESQVSRARCACLLSTHHTAHVKAAALR